jgi:hypothetical protein
MYDYGCWELQPDGAVEIGLHSAGSVKGDYILFAYSGTVREIVGHICWGCGEIWFVETRNKVHLTLFRSFLS